MRTKVFDENGQERTLQWLAASYDGCGVLPADTTGATEVWRLAAIYVTEGPAVLKIETRRGDGPAANQPVALTWPNLSNPSPDLATISTTNNWSPRAVVSRTGPDGLYGAGLGSTFGPFYHAWVVSTAPSDCLTGAGMKGGTNHRGPLHGVWVLQPVDTDPPDDQILARLEALHTDLKQLMRHLGAL